MNDCPPHVNGTLIYLSHRSSHSDIIGLTLTTSNVGHFCLRPVALVVSRLYTVLVYTTAVNFYIDTGTRLKRPEIL